MALLLIWIPLCGVQHYISKEDMGQHLFEPVCHPCNYYEKPKFYKPIEIPDPN